MSQSLSRAADVMGFRSDVFVYIHDDGRSYLCRISGDDDYLKDARIEIIKELPEEDDSDVPVGTLAYDRASLEAKGIEVVED